MIEQREALRLYGCETFDPLGKRVGIVGQLFLDDATEQPAWITVELGLFGTNESYVPLEGAAFDGDTLTVAVHRSIIRNAPPVTLEQGDLPLEQERQLYMHYGIEYGIRPEDMSITDPTTSTRAPDYVDAVRLRLRRWAPI